MENEPLIGIEIGPALWLGIAAGVTVASLASRGPVPQGRLWAFALGGGVVALVVEGALGAREGRRLEAELTTDEGEELGAGAGFARVLLFPGEDL